MISRHGIQILSLNKACCKRPLKILHFPKCVNNGKIYICHIDPKTLRNKNKARFMCHVKESLSSRIWVTCGFTYDFHGGNLQVFREAVLERQLSNAVWWDCDPLLRHRVHLHLAVRARPQLLDVKRKVLLFPQVHIAQHYRKQCNMSISSMDTHILMGMCGHIQLKSSFITTMSNRDFSLDLTDREEGDSPIAYGSVSCNVSLLSLMTQQYSLP